MSIKPTSQLKWLSNKAILTIETWKDSGLFDGSAVLDLGNDQPPIEIKTKDTKNIDELKTIKELCFYSYWKIDSIIKQNPTYATWLAALPAKLHTSYSTADEWIKYPEEPEEPEEIMDRILMQLNNVLGTKDPETAEVFQKKPPMDKIVELVKETFQEKEEIEKEVDPEIPADAGNQIELF